LLALQVRSRYADRLPPAGEPVAFVQSRSRLIHDRNVQVMLADELVKKVGLLRLKAPACTMRSPPHCTSAQCQRIRIADFAYLLLFLPPHTCYTSERTSMIAQPTAPPDPTNPPGCIAARPKRRSLALHDARMLSQPYKQQVLRQASKSCYNFVRTACNKLQTPRF
jgi:hypothetical protein